MRRKLSPEEQSLDQFLDGLASPYESHRRPPANELEHFAGWFKALPGTPALPPVESDPVLKKILAVQQQQMHAGDFTALPPKETQDHRSNERRRDNRGMPGQPAWGLEQASSGRLWTQVPSYAIATIILGLVATGMFTFFYDRGNDPEPRPQYLGEFEKEGSAGSIIASPVADPLPRVTVDGVNISIRDWNLLGIIRTAFADEKPARDLFLELDVTLVNTEDITNHEAPFKDLWVVDENDEAYAIDKYGTVLANDAIYRSESVSNIALEPGVEHQVILMFDVPSDITTLYLTDTDRTFTIPIVGP